MKGSARQDVKHQAISLIFLLQWLQDGVDMGMKMHTDLGEFLSLPPHPPLKY